METTKTLDEALAVGQTALSDPADPATRREVASELLTPVVLMLLATGPARSSQILQALSELCCDELDQATLEDLLAAAENSGRVRSSLGSSDPGRRTYQLTRLGRAELVSAVGAVHRSQRLLATMAARYERSIAGGPASSKASASSS